MLDQAVIEYTKTILIDLPLFKAYNALGVICDQRGEHLKAIEHYKQALKLNAANAVASYAPGPNNLSRYPLICSQGKDILMHEVTSLGCVDWSRNVEDTSCCQ